MSNHRTCCCGSGACSSLWRVFVPCIETEQNVSLRQPAVLTASLEASDLSQGVTYLYSPTLECEPYCGTWQCLTEMTEDDLCRDSPADPDNCPDCDTDWTDPYRLVNQTEVDTGFFDDFEAMDSCCDLDCPTVCDNYGTPLGSDCFSCYDAETQLSYQLDYSFTNIPSERDIQNQADCPSGTVSTSASMTTLGGWSGVNPTTGVLYIVALLRFNLTTTPWHCDNLLGEGCGGWCFEGDPTPGDRPVNTQYRDMYLIVDVGCSAAPNAGYDRTPEGVLPSNVTQAIPELAGVTQALWTSGDCGIGGFVPQAPIFSNENFSVTPDVSASMGWGGNALCLDETVTWKFNVMNECTPTIGATTGGDCSLRVRVALSLPNRPGDC